MGKKTCEEYNYKIPAQASKITDIIKELICCIRKFDHKISDLEFRFEIAAREMLANAIEHGCDSKDDDVIIVLNLKYEEISLTVKDPGDGFHWQDYNYEIEPVLDERGRGLKMIKQVSDDIVFNHKGNIIKITFNGGGASNDQ